MSDTNDLIPDTSMQISQGTDLRPDPNQPAIGDREQRIRARAHEIWEAEGRPSDRAEAHWQQAEQELSPDTSDYVLQPDDGAKAGLRGKRSTPK